MTTGAIVSSDEEYFLVLEKCDRELMSYSMKRTFNLKSWKPSSHLINFVYLYFIKSWVCNEKRFKTLNHSTIIVTVDFAECSGLIDQIHHLVVSVSNANIVLFNENEPETSVNEK